MKKIITFFLLLLPLLIHAQSKVEIDGIYYIIKNNEAAVTCFSKYTDNGTFYKGHVSIPSTVQYEGVTYPVTSIGSYAFTDCSFLTSVSIPNSVTSIGECAFSRTGLTAITIPESVNKIESSAFFRCYNLRSITIPELITSISESAFIGCHNLNDIIIPKSVTSIGDRAFSGLKLQNIKCKATVVPSVLLDEGSYITTGIFSEQTYAHANLYVPEGTWYAYAFDDSWYRFANIKEYADEVSKVSKTKAYTLMDENYNYAVYDEGNDCVRMVEAHKVDEQNTNTSWTMQEIGNKKYLYNMGAKRFAVRSSEGQIALSETPTAVDAQNVDGGISINGGSAHWNFVANDQLAAGNFGDIVQDITTAVQSVSPVVEAYTIDGCKAPHSHKGISILRHADGRVSKVIK